MATANVHTREVVEEVALALSGDEASALKALLGMAIGAEMGRLYASLAQAGVSREPYYTRPTALGGLRVCRREGK